MDFRYIAVEGPIAVGKFALTQKLAARLDASVILDETENPFLPDFYAGRAGAAFQAQLFSLLGRHRQQTSLRQANLFAQLTISDYLFDKDKIYAYLNLDDNELFIYQKLFELLSQNIVAPDVVVYLQTPTDVLRHRAEASSAPNELTPDDAYLSELNEAYNHFFFHYSATPLLVVETSDFDLEWGERAVDALIKQLSTIGQGTRYYVPRTSGQ